jgi:hypothetical protein
MLILMRAQYIGGDSKWGREEVKGKGARDGNRLIYRV